jgi:hypothetical protein
MDRDGGCSWGEVFGGMEHGVGGAKARWLGGARPEVDGSCATALLVVEAKS